MRQDFGRELGWQLQQLSSRLFRGGRGLTWQEEGAHLVGDRESLGSVLVAEERRSSLALTGRVEQCGELGEQCGELGGHTVRSEARARDSPR